MKFFIKNLHLIFMPRRAPTNGANGVKQDFVNKSLVVSEFLSAQNRSSKNYKIGP